MTSKLLVLLQHFWYDTHFDSALEIFPEIIYSEGIQLVFLDLPEKLLGSIKYTEEYLMRPLDQLLLEKRDNNHIPFLLLPMVITIIITHFFLFQLEIFKGQNMFHLAIKSVGLSQQHFFVALDGTHLQSFKRLCFV